MEPGYGFCPQIFLWEVTGVLDEFMSDSSGKRGIWASGAKRVSVPWMGCPPNSPSVPGPRWTSESMEFDPKE